MHADIEDITSGWYRHQCGTWVASTGSTCANPAGTGYIRPDTYRDGVERHERGSQNSHHRQYVVAQDDPANNLKTGAESFIGSPSQTKSGLREAVEAALELRKGAIIFAAAVEPCHKQCSADCSAFNGLVNPPPYSTPACWP